MKPVLPATLVLSWLGISACLTAQATTIYVDGSSTSCPGQGTQSKPFCQIQTAIQAATNGATVLVMPGTYKEAIDFLGKAITVRSTAGPRTTILDGQQRQVSVVTFKNKEGRNSVLEGFTVRNGLGSLQPFYSTQQITGGGIVCVGASPTISNVVLTGNSAKYGAGIYGVQGSSCLLTNVVLTGNSATANGGGAVFMGNSTPSFVGCLFSKNTCGHTGGGLNVRDSAPFLANCVFDRNSATDMGGAVRIGALSSGTFVNCSFYGNTSRYGGGVACGSDTQGKVGLVTISNSILWSNTASYGPELSLNGRYACNMNISYSNVRGGKTSVYIQTGFTLTWGTGMINSDPLFVDPNGGDFHILHTSPCRDSGSAVSGQQKTDFEGDPRVWGNAADMGADEFFPRLYHTGSPKPGGKVTIKVVGQPGSSAAWYVGTSARKAPLPIAGLSGALELSGVIFVTPLGKLPASGLATMPPIAVPSNTPPVDVPCQALIGTRISNLDVVSIR